MKINLENKQDLGANNLRQITSIPLTKRSAANTGQIYSSCKGRRLCVVYGPEYFVYFCLKVVKNKYHRNNFG